MAIKAAKMTIETGSEHDDSNWITEEKGVPRRASSKREELRAQFCLVQIMLA
jgi:hypothetical protein